jgi:integrase
VQEVQESRAYYKFIHAIHSEKTKKLYNRSLKKYLEHYKISMDDLLSIPVKTIEEHIIDYLVGNKSYMGKRMTINALKKFCEMNDLVLNWKKISQYIGEYQRVSRDRAYTDKEIKTLVDSADLRMKVILLLMASSGMRIGAVPDLKLKHVSGNKITVYENTKEEYYTFITGECRQVLDAYLDYRTRSGEKLNPDSPLVRKQFDINDLEQVRKQSAPVALNTLNVILDHHLQRCGLRTVNHVESSDNNGNRKSVARAHGFRKFFTTQLVNSKVNPEIREMLLGHSIGLAGAYYKPTEDEMLDEYMKAADNLTINEENRLKKKVEMLTIEKSKVDQALSDIQDMKTRLGLV